MSEDQDTTKLQIKLVTQLFNMTVLPCNVLTKNSFCPLGTKIIIELQPPRVKNITTNANKQY